MDEFHSKVEFWLITLNIYNKKSTHFLDFGIIMAKEIPRNILKKSHIGCWFFLKFGSPKIKLICELHAFMLKLVKNDNFWCSTWIFDLVGALHENGLNIPWTDSTSNLCSKLNSQLITEFNMTGTYWWDFIHLWW